MFTAGLGRLGRFFTKGSGPATLPVFGAIVPSFEDFVAGLDGDSSGDFLMSGRKNSVGRALDWDLSEDSLIIFGSDADDDVFSQVPRGSCGAQASTVLKVLGDLRKEVTIKLNTRTSTICDSPCPKRGPDVSEIAGFELDKKTLDGIFFDIPFPRAGSKGVFVVKDLLGPYPQFPIAVQPDHQVVETHRLWSPEADGRRMLRSSRQRRFQYKTSLVRRNALRRRPSN